VPSYFEAPEGFESPYKTHTFDNKTDSRDFISAVHNADLTGRVQTVPKE
jgi:predicted NodU family carbamoyl transferase